MSPFLMPSCPAASAIPFSSVVEFGVDPGYGNQASTPGFSQSHAVALSPLVPSTGWGVTLLPPRAMPASKASVIAFAVVTETIFAWPGIGRLTIEAINQRDYPVVQGCILVIAAGFLVASAAADVANAWLDPRVRAGTAPSR